MNTPVPASGAGLVSLLPELPPIAVPLQVATGVFWVRLPMPFSLDAINVWLIKEPEGWAVVDSGLNTEATLAAWGTLEQDFLAGQPLSRVFATHMHPDHTGVAGWLTEKYRCRWWITQLEYLTCQILALSAHQAVSDEALGFYRSAGWDDREVDDYKVLYRHFCKAIHSVPQAFRRIADGDIFTIGAHEWRVIGTAGHSREHASFYCPELKLLISGDQVLPSISSNLSVFHDEPEANPAKDWLASLQKLREQVPDDVLVLPSHGRPFWGLHERLNQLVQSQMNSLLRLKESLSNPQRIVDLFPILFAKDVGSDVMQRWLATGETRALLNYLMGSGDVVVDRDQQGIIWFSKRSGSSD